MKEIDVRFDSGRDVLNAYWGYLSDGGLVIQDCHGLDEGQPVSLNVHIASSDSKYLLAGKVVKRQPSAAQLVIAFQPGEPHDMLLTEALAETDNVPARRHRRFRVDIGARVWGGEVEGEPISARLVNISLGGCCVQLEEESCEDLSIGTQVAMQASELDLSGKVVWVRHRERGVRFEALEPRTQGELEAYLRAL